MPPPPGGAERSTRVYSPRRLHRLPLLVRRLPLQPLLQRPSLPGARAVALPRGGLRGSGVRRSDGPFVTETTKTFHSRLLLHIENNYGARVRASSASCEIIEKCCVFDSRKIQFWGVRVRVVTSYGEPVREEGGREGGRATGS